MRGANTAATRPYGMRARAGAVTGGDIGSATRRLPGAARGRDGAARRFTWGGRGPQARRRDDAQRRLERAARLRGRRRDLRELHEVAGREPARDLPENELATRAPLELVDELVRRELERIEAEARAQVLAHDLGHREVERPVVGVLEEAVLAEAIELLERDLVRGPRRRPG